MCGRYVRKAGKQKIAEAFNAKPVGELPMPDADYNISPTSNQPIIRESRDTGEREIVLARWGIVPFFTKSLADVKSNHLARAESITTTRSFREPIKKRRCLVPASAFYEWPEQGKPPKQPYLFEMTDAGMFAFAGIWDAWKDEQGHWTQSFALISTGANELLGRIHTRMPVILHQRDYDRWLDRGETEQLPLDLLRPYESESMEMHEANPAVNNSRNNGPEMLTPPAEGNDGQ
jgi:putative SOS response-associated peptidase YedK